MNIRLPLTLLTFLKLTLCVSQSDFRTNDTTKKERVPIKSAANSTAIVSPSTNKSTPPLNGFYVLYNKKRQKTKEGTFQDNRLKDGKNYIYDNQGALIRIDSYENFQLVGSATPWDK